MDSDESELEFSMMAAAQTLKTTSIRQISVRAAESASNRPGTPTGDRRVSTSFGLDYMAPAAARVEFSPRRRPGVDLGLVLRRFVRAAAR